MDVLPHHSSNHGRVPLYYQICHILENIEEFSLIVNDKILNDFIQTVKKGNDKNKETKINVQIIHPNHESGKAQC